MMSSARRLTMDVHEREAGDLIELERLIACEARAKQRDRYRMALWAIGGMEAEQIGGWHTHAFA
jgi:hypothetical protein